MLRFQRLHLYPRTKLCACLKSFVCHFITDNRYPISDNGSNKAEGWVKLATWKVRQNQAKGVYNQKDVYYNIIDFVNNVSWYTLHQQTEYLATWITSPSSLSCSNSIFLNCYENNANKSEMSGLENLIN